MRIKRHVLVRIGQTGRNDKLPWQRTYWRFRRRDLARVQFLQELHIALAQSAPCPRDRRGRGGRHALGGRNVERLQSGSIQFARDREAVANLITSYRCGSLAIVSSICFPLVKPGLLEPFLHLLHRLICRERSNANSKRQSNQQDLFHHRTIESKSRLRAYQVRHRSAVNLVRYDLALH